MIFFISEDIILVFYGFNVIVECRVVGFLRFIVMLVINGVSMYIFNGGWVVMVFYEVILIYVVKMLFDLECYIFNRLGSSFLRMWINLKGINWKGFVFCVSYL